MGSRPLRERDQGLSLIDIAENDPKRSDVNTPFEISVGKQADSKDVVFSARHVSPWSLLTSIRVGFAFFSIALALDAAASIKEEGPTPDLVGKTRLTSTEITRLILRSSIAVKFRMRGVFQRRPTGMQTGPS